MIFSIKNDSRPWSIPLRGLAVFQVWVMGGGSFFVRLLGPVRAVRIKEYKRKTARTVIVRAVFCKAEEGGFENEKIA